MLKIFFWQSFLFKKISLLLFLIAVAFVVKSQQDTTRKWPDDVMVRYSKTDSLIIHSSTATDSVSVGKVQYADILVVLNDTGNKEWLQVISPFEGYIPSNSVYSDIEIDSLQINKVNLISELDLVYAGLSPYKEIRKSRLRRSSDISSQRKWVVDKTHKVKIVRARRLYLRKEATTESDSLWIFDLNDKIIIDNNYKENDEWCKVLFPHPGYVYKKYLYTNDEIVKLKEKEINQLNKIENSKQKTSELDIKGDYKKYQNKEIETNEDTCYVVLTNNSKTPDDSVKIWWTETTDNNKTQLLKKPVLNIRINTIKDSKNKYKSVIYFRENDDENYKIIHTSKAFEPNKTYSVKISEEANLSKKGPYKFRIDLFDSKIQDTSRMDSVIIHRNHELYIMAVYSPVMKPIEKDFNNYKITWGINIEYSRTGNKFAIGIGHNRLQAKSGSEDYLLKTNTSCLYGKYIPFRLFKEHLNIFASAGLTYWKSTFQNIRYPGLPDYFPKEQAKGINFLTGGGVIYNYRNFFLGAQYILYFSPNASFGKMPVDPVTSEDLQNYIPTTQYKLYTGSNQLQIVFGYRFDFKTKP